MAALGPEGFSGRFAALLDVGGGREPTLLGVEHEYRVARVDGTAVDFRGIVHGLGLGRRHLDPDDPYAYRLESGNAVTCDEAEAEIVLAPVPLGPGGVSWLTTAAAAERDGLAARLERGPRLEGHSTHISVSVRDDLAEPVGRAFARAYGADVARLVGSPDRCGVWVRPRPERLELCLDWVTGSRLAAVLTFSAGAVEACIAAVLSGDDEGLPPAVRVFARRPRQRAGWHLPRAAFRGDPFDERGESPLELSDGGSMPAAAHLDIAWGTVRPRAAGFASTAELSLTDAVVRSACADPTARGDVDAPAPTRRLETPRSVAAFGGALLPRLREGYELAVVALTWRFAAFLLLRRGRWWQRERRGIAVVPRRALPAFVERLDAGDLDDVIRAYLATRPTHRALVGSDQAAEAGLYDAIPLRRDLLPAEPVVRSLRLEPSPVAP